MFFDVHLRDIATKNPQFNTFTLVDRNPLSGHNKIRIIHAPNDDMREVHKRFIRWLRKLRIEMPYATAALPGMSPLRNVNRHRQYGRRKNGRTPFRRYLYLLDLKSAYQNVDPEKLAAIIWKRNRTLPGDEQEVLEFLWKYCLSKEEGGLLVGAPASPDLFNIYAREVIDVYLEPVCEQYNLVYSRYLDDLTFSAERKIGWRKREIIRDIILRAGFDISHRKSHILDLAKHPVAINGVGIELSGRVFMPRHALLSLRSLLYRAVSGYEVSPHQIHGTMGLFKSLTDLDNPNEAEKEIIRLYQQFRERSS